MTLVPVGKAPAIVAAVRRVHETHSTHIDDLELLAAHRVVDAELVLVREVHDNVVAEPLRRDDIARRAHVVRFGKRGPAVFGVHVARLEEDLEKLHMLAPPARQHRRGRVIARTAGQRDPRKRQRRQIVVGEPI